MDSHLKLNLGSLLLVLGLHFLLVQGETGCPPPEDIEPCVCTDIPSARLTCNNVRSLYVLEEVFKNSERYFYQEVYIRSSSLLYLPHEIVNKTKVGELFVIKSTLVQLFDEPPRSNSLYKIHLEDTKMQRGNDASWGLLKNVTSLREISVTKALMRSIPSDFGGKFPSSLRQISINGTQIRKIFPGALNGLDNLDKFAVQFGRLTNLTRNVFPRPFNVRFLYFDHNDIKFIPEDLFTEMPNLQFLTMRYNHLSVIPEAAFSGRSGNVPYLGFEGNPLQCNCLLVWLVKDKPEVIGGTCSEPTIVRGKQLQNLLPGDFNC